MRKTILIGLVAITMLFAFTACEQPQMEWPYTGNDAKNVMGITLVNPSDVALHAGENFKTVYTEINIAYKDGTSDSNVMAEISMSGAAAVGQNKMSVKWGGDFTETGNVIVDALEATSITLAVENTTDLESAPTTGTLTVIYSDGFEKEITEFTGLKAGETENTVIAVLGKGTRASVDLTSNEVAYTIKAGPATPSYDDIRPIWTKTDGTPIEADADDLWIGDTVYLEVAVYSTTTDDKYVIEAANLDLVQNGVLLSDAQKAAALSGKTLTAKTGDTYTVRYNGENLGTIQIPAGQNYMITNTFDATIFVPTATPVTPGVTKISAELFSVEKSKLQYQVPLSDANCDDGVEVVSIVNDGLIIPSDAEGTYDITVNINITKKGETTPSTVTVSVPVAEVVDET